MSIKLEDLKRELVEKEKKDKRLSLLIRPTIHAGIENIAKELNVSTNEMINIALEKFILSITEDTTTEADLIKPKKNKSNPSGVCGRRKKKKVVMLTFDSKIVKEFESITQAGKETGFSAGNICSACKNEPHLHKGYIWRYANEYYTEKKHVTPYNLIVKNGPVKVEQYSLEGDFIKKYDNIAEAAKSIGIDRGGICKACSGIQKSAGGFIWKKA